MELFAFLLSLAQRSGVRGLACRLHSYGLLEVFIEPFDALPVFELPLQLSTPVTWVVTVEPMRRYRRAG